MHVTRYASADLPTDDEELQEVSLETCLSGALSTFATNCDTVYLVLLRITPTSPALT